MLVGGSRPLVQWNARNKGKPPMATVLNEIKRWKSDVPRPQTPRERFLAAGKNKLDRLKLRAKWILLRQNRPFNVDEISAFLSWIVMGNFLWIFIGTTTFCGLIIYAGNLFTDGKINKKVLEKLITLDNKLQVDITGNDFKASWEDGMIKFQNLVMNSGANGHLKYSFKIDTVTVTLSLSKWMEGKGLIKDVNLTGVIGTADLDEHYEEVMDEAFSPQYEFEQFEVNNLKLVMKRKKSAPMEVEIFNCKLPKLRRNWITYDFINADALSGSINGSLITLHKRQHQFAQFAGMDTTEDNSPWKKVTRLRIDQLDLSRVTGPKSKLNWLRAGTVELVVDIMLPTEDDNESLTDLLLPGHQGVEGNKYVVLDCKINFHDLQARMPAKTPSSSLTQTPYISETDLRGLVSFINNKRFGLALRASEGWDIDETATYDRAELAADADLRDNDESQVPTVKFRLVHNLADFELVDIVAILGLHSDTVHDLGPLQQLSYQNSNKLLDSAMTELLGCLMLYKEELQQRLIGAYAKRTKFEIFFNNFVLGNLLLVGLGSFVI
ncbi:hypothetical protein OGAPHI_002943 [Ogataea philodendri]|uniref:Mitochondrial distribution and morphology protein 31 n=1 Tax=Ogataea philodendri TaxID=1378263 RepID=A0A9P8T6E3_9ASCO|nr:uncharacterized protein OGAPHI_002943 [Ogataea philodendri]KAH3667294.1 hypothetical protein OGAPHI_002943 [Ogataea philodendri]